MSVIREQGRVYDMSWLVARLRQAIAFGARDGRPRTSGANSAAVTHVGICQTGCAKTR